MPSRRDVIELPESFERPPRGGPPSWVNALPPLAKLMAILPIAAAAWFFYWWFVQRVEVEPGKVLVLVRKVGQELRTPGEGPVSPGDPVSTQMVLYPALLEALGEPKDSTRFKGIMYGVLPEGRYFFDPFLWERREADAVIIDQDEVGILVRQYGKPLGGGKIVATRNDERGPLADVLMPGRYNINPYAYEVRRVKPVSIPPGFVGVQRLLHGDEPNNPNAFVVEAGARGVQPDVLPPGLYYNNPYVRQIDLIDVRSHTLDLRGHDAIKFPSSDSFDIIIEATIEYAISQDKAPYVMVAIGGHKDIEEELILPFARSLSRIEGSKLVARDFIAGESRTKFQNAFFEGLRTACAAQGIEIRATLIRRIEPPTAIANPISDRQLAEQQIAQYENEIRVAKAQAQLVEQEEMRKQNQAIGETNRDVVAVVKESEQRKAVALTEVQRKFEVAKLALEAARENAAATLARGKADAEVITLQFKAEAEPLADAVAAFGAGDAYAQYYFYQRLGPALKSILASTEGPFADIFKALSPSAIRAAPPAHEQTIRTEPPREPAPTAVHEREGGPQ